MMFSEFQELLKQNPEHEEYTPGWWRVKVNGEKKTFNVEKYYDGHIEVYEIGGDKFENLMSKLSLKCTSSGIEQAIGYGFVKDEEAHREALYWDKEHNKKQENKL